MSDCRRTFLALASIALLGAAPIRAASAQEAPEDESAYERAKIALQVPKQLRRAKRRRARKGGWVWTAVANATTGYDSNVHEGPGRELPGDLLLTSAGVFDFDGKLEGLHYFTRDDRLKFSVETLNHPVTATSKAADYTQRGRFFYAHEFLDRKASVAFKGAISHTNDSVTTSRGTSVTTLSGITRDFENFVYRGSGALRVRLPGKQRLSLGYGFKRKDYFETAGRASLDWLRHGPAAAWSVDVGRILSAKASYDFWIQNYDANPSSSLVPGNIFGGTEFPSNPTEEHFFHTAKFRLRWRPDKRAWIDTRYRFRSKDDRFQKYESYDDHGVELAGHITLIDALELEASGAYHRRNFDHRLGDAGHKLHYDLWKAKALVRYGLTPHVAVYSVYDFETRDTNRTLRADNGKPFTTYRDYTRHVVLFGVTVAY